MKRILALIVLVVSACSPAKKIQKAEQIVIYNPASFEKLGKRWAELNPCANDTFIVDNPIDSLTFADYLTYLENPPKPNTFKADSLPQYLKDAYYLGYTDASVKLSSVKIPKCPTKTSIAYVVDNRKVKLGKDSIDKLNVEKSLLLGQITELQKATAQQGKKITGWIWWFVLATSLFGITLVLALVGAIKRIIP